ncbi:sigma factor-like helix-turn-helix DNA-binding protein [Nocardioides sp. URHA0032]|uniref:sigma factor-like helix-turn-helix DNA-binding protein n=1 Tax=Nocardioides sp. URHA0032 TaxID=1380388 RepID=UPI0004907437|nr:sigma factor-like helix-turn-helix DNA-binding protein [Nocardioides sp. URHA0032]
MAGNDADFAAYLAARWPFLVRSLVLIGWSPVEAEDIALTGLARCRSAWGRMREVDDVDAEVFGTVLEARPHAPPSRPGAPLDDPSEAELLRQELEQQLTRLAPEEREAVVLRFVGGLDEVQVADTLDVPVATVGSRVAQGLARIEPPALRAEEAFRTAAGSIEVPTAPYDGVVARAREQRRRRWRIVAGAAAAILVVAGGTTWLTTRPEKPAEPETTRVVASPNPVDISWYDGRLHLRRVAVHLPGLTSVAGVGESAAFIDTDGAVGVVQPAGEVALVGRSAPGSRVLGSAENGWAAWVEPGDPASRIVVWSVGNHEEVDSLVVAPGTRLVAIDQDRVYATGDAGAFEWRPAHGRPVRLDEPGLLDVGSSTRVYQRHRAITVVQPFYDVTFTRRGEGAAVSPGGTFVLSRIPGPWVPGSPFTPLVYDARTGDLLPSGVAPDERVVDAAFGNNHEINYLVANVSDLEGVDLDGARSRLFVLRTCALERSTCSDVVPVRSAADRAMFAP